MKNAIAIFLVILAIGLFAMYTNPAYQEVKTLQAQVAAYDGALTQSTQLRAARDELLARRNTFSTDDVRRLERMLPDNVDNIRLIIDIDNIAARYGLKVKNVALGQTSSSQGTQAQSGSVGAGTSAVGTVELGFAVDATYDNFIAFLNDLERSLRIVDVESIKFRGGQGDLDSYALQIKTYWLR